GACQNPATLGAACVFTELEKLNLRVITSKSSRFVDTDKVVNFLKNNIPGLTVSYLDYTDKKAGELIKRFNIQAIPAYMLDKKAEEKKTFEGIKQYFVLEEGLYVARPQFTGVTFFLNRKRFPGRIDLFFSMYDKDADPLLSSIKDFKPEVHFLVTETDKGFEAKYGQAELEDDLRAVCVKAHYPEIFWDYISCRSQNSSSSWWEDCLG
ncbi:MAG: hypothetical protein NT033_05970, partial [Candidatus Omnitrophica bacterium]|nr:hypothetical protein [Candidatus Omnitrophota bacterium]